MMTAYENMAYGKRHGFVYLRYVAAVFFFLSMLADYFVILNVLTQAGNALNSFDTLDIMGLLQALSSFKITGPFGTVIDIFRKLGALVIPLYFIATISFVLNLNRREILKVTLRAAIMAFLMFIAQFIIYMILVGLVVLLVMSLTLSIEEKFADVIDVVNEIIEMFNSGANPIPFANVEEALDYAQTFVSTQLTLVLFRNLPSMNIFLDQFLCLLMCIFFVFRPKWVNTKAKKILYRTLGFIPIIYIIVTFVMNGLIQSGAVMPNLTLMCLFPSKKLPHFIFIGCILLCNRLYPIKSFSGNYVFTNSRTKVYRATPLAFETPVVAKRRALKTAVFLSLCLSVLCAVDFGLGMLPVAAKWGLGKSYYAICCIPFLFLFDDRKPTKKRDYSIFSVFYMILIIIIVLIYMFF